MKKADTNHQQGSLITKGASKSANPVADDQNWRICVQNELKSVNQWNQDWSFLVQMQNQDYKPMVTKEERIRQLEEELEAAKQAKSLSKTSDTYGKGQNLELFSMKHLNRRKDPDLMPCPRRPPKNHK